AVEESAVAHCQVATLGPDAGAVLVGHRDAMKLDAIDDDVGGRDHPDRLALRVLAVGKQPGPAAHAADLQVGGTPSGHVAAVVAGGNPHHVASLSGRRGGT